jgi:transcriptional regulator with XRE-family HTH domain
VNLSQAYKSGLSLRKIAAELGINHPFSVACLLERAGVARRPNGNAHLYPRIKIQCAVCGRQFDREAFYVKNGCGIKSKPNPPRRRVCSRICYGRLISQDNIERARKTVSIQVDYR